MGRSGPTQTTSMKDVARMAGVSAMTVSRAMRVPGSVSPDVLARVQAAIQSSGYVPNRIAGNLSSNRSSVVALIVPSLRNALYTEMIQGISDVLTRNALHLMISDVGYDLLEEEKLIGEYIAQRVCGVVLHHTRHLPRTVRMLRGSGIPCVETGNLLPQPIDMAVSYSNFDAGVAMAKHLLEAGYQRIAFASLPVAGNERLQQRRKGFLSALRRAGLAVPAHRIVEVGAGLENGARALDTVLAADASVHALFCAGDVLAAGALFECQRRRIAVPEAMAIAASDDNDLMQHSVPPLTTVAFPRYEIGVRAASMIVARMKGVRPAQPVVDVGFHVVHRGST